MTRQIEKYIKDHYAELRRIDKLRQIQRINYYHDKYPELANLKYKISALRAKNLLSVSTNEKVEINQEIEILKGQLTKLKKNNNIPDDYDEIHFFCKQCKDTGYINNKPCSCYRHEMKKVISKLNLTDFSIGKSFKIFDANIAEDESQRTRLLQLKKYFIHYSNNYDHYDENGFFFTGKPGTGKSYMAICIAKELLANGVAVQFINAMDFAYINMDYDSSRRFKPDLERLDIIENKYKLVFEIEFLIIDDLGIELDLYPESGTKLTYLLSKRTENKKRTILISNLDSRDILNNYGERVRSRLAGELVPVKFYGSDLRRLSSRA